MVIDFRKYFDNIEHKPLFDVYSRYIRNQRLNRMCRSFVTATGKKGLFIGPEDSQISAIAYPSKIDHKIKDTWRCKYYARYMDDSFIIMRSKDDLRKIRDMLFTEYSKQGIILNPKKTQIVKLSRGFTFLKTQFILQPNGRVIHFAAFCFAAGGRFFFMRVTVFRKPVTTALHRVSNENMLQ